MQPVSKLFLFTYTVTGLLLRVTPCLRGATSPTQPASADPGLYHLPVVNGLWLLQFSHLPHFVQKQQQRRSTHGSHNTGQVSSQSCQTHGLSPPCALSLHVKKGKPVV